MRSKILSGYNLPYTIWEDGRVTGGRDPDKVLKHNIGKDGPRVRLYKSDGNDYVLVRRLLATSFIPNPHGEPAIRHIDNDQNNIALSNLEWSDMAIIVNNTVSRGLLNKPWDEDKKVDKTKTCVYCKKQFKYTYQNKGTKCCSRSCAIKLRYYS